MSGGALRNPGGCGSQKCYRELAQGGGKVVSPTHLPNLPQDTSLVPISVRGRFDPRAIVQPEEKQMCIYRNSLRVSANKRKRA